MSSLWLIDDSAQSADDAEDPGTRQEEPIESDAEAGPVRPVGGQDSIEETTRRPADARWADERAPLRSPPDQTLLSRMEALQADRCNDCVLCGPDKRRHPTDKSSGRRIIPRILGDFRKRFLGKAK